MNNEIIKNLCELSNVQLGIIILGAIIYISSSICMLLHILKTLLDKECSEALFIFFMLGIILNGIVLIPVLGWLIKLILC